MAEADSQHPCTFCFFSVFHLGFLLYSFSLSSVAHEYRVCASLHQAEGEKGQGRMSYKSSSALLRFILVRQWLFLLKCFVKALPNDLLAGERLSSWKILCLMKKKQCNYPEFKVSFSQLLIILLFFMFSLLRSNVPIPSHGSKIFIAFSFGPVCAWGGLDITRGLLNMLLFVL